MTYKENNLVNNAPTRINLICAAFLGVLPLFSQGSWTAVAPMPTGRMQYASVRLSNGLIYTIGGQLGTPPYTAPTNVVEIYNPATNTWSAGPSMPSVRYSLAAAVAGGVIYAIGGYNGGNTNAVEAFDPQVGFWVSKSPLPTARNGLAAVTGPDGKIYAMGGDVQGGGENVATVEIYDPSTNTWTPGPSMPSVRSGFKATLGTTGLIFVIGGGSNGSILSSVDALNPVNGVWTSRAPMSVARSSAGQSLASDGRIFVIGGHLGFGLLTNSVEAYSPSTNTWSLQPSLSAARSDLAAETGLDGRIYAMGGWIPGVPIGTQVLNTVEAFGPQPGPRYKVCLLYDLTKAAKAGSTIPIKIKLCDDAGTNLSSASLVVHATNVTKY